MSAAEQIEREPYEPTPLRAKRRSLIVQEIKARGEVCMNDLAETIANDKHLSTFSVKEELRLMRVEGVLVSEGRRVGQVLRSYFRFAKATG